MRCWSRASILLSTSSPVYNVCVQERVHNDDWPHVHGMHKNSLSHSLLLLLSTCHQHVLWCKFLIYLIKVRCTEEHSSCHSNKLHLDSDGECRKLFKITG